jgi:Heterokaryon incompatibility protein (HET)
MHVLMLPFEAHHRPNFDDPLLILKVQKLIILGIKALLSRTIKDAMHCCEQLGERYLWVDTLCINQDDQTSNRHPIANMDKIYRSASVTIVATAGDDANASLPGGRHSRMKRMIKMHVNYLDLATSCSGYDVDVLDSKWHTRGWTCQEKLLSTLLLIFTHHQTFFKCSVEDWSEDIVACDSSIGVRMRLHRNVRKIKDVYVVYGRPILEQCASALCDYTSRDLTNESDALNAFEGVMATLSHRSLPFRGGELVKGIFHQYGDGDQQDEQGSLTRWMWGLPEVDFVPALLWGTNGCPVKKSRPSFPSWSWTGWKLQVQYPEAFANSHVFGSHLLLCGDTW